MEGALLERHNMKIATVPVDMSTAANTGLRVNMKNQSRVAFIVMLAVGSVRTASFALKQHTAASSGTSKALAVSNPYFVKAAAATSFTKTTPGSATDTYDLSTTFVTNGGIVVFEVLAEDLDRDNGFGWVSLDTSDAGANASLGTVLAITSLNKKMPPYDEAI